MNEVQVAGETVELDLRGMECPFVLAEIIRALDEQGGAALEVISDHPHSVNTTVPAFCRRHGYDLAVERVQGPVFRMRIRRSSPPSTR